MIVKIDGQNQNLQVNIEFDKLLPLIMETVLDPLTMSHGLAQLREYAYSHPILGKFIVTDIIDNQLLKACPFVGPELAIILSDVIHKHPELASFVANNIIEHVFTLTLLQEKISSNTKIYYADTFIKAIKTNLESGNDPDELNNALLTKIIKFIDGGGIYLTLMHKFAYHWLNHTTSSPETSLAILNKVMAVYNNDVIAGNKSVFGLIPLLLENIASLNRPQISNLIEVSYTEAKSNQKHIEPAAQVLFLLIDKFYDGGEDFPAGPKLLSMLMDITKAGNTLGNYQHEFITLAIVKLASTDLDCYNSLQETAKNIILDTSREPNNSGFILICQVLEDIAHENTGISPKCLILLEGLCDQTEDDFQLAEIMTLSVKVLAALKHTSDFNLDSIANNFFNKCKAVNTEAEEAKLKALAHLLALDQNKVTISLETYSDIFGHHLSMRNLADDRIMKILSDISATIRKNLKKIDFNSIITDHLTEVINVLTPLEISKTELKMPILSQQYSFDSGYFSSGDEVNTMDIIGEGPNPDNLPSSKGKDGVISDMD